MLKHLANHARWKISKLRLCKHTLLAQQQAGCVCRLAKQIVEEAKAKHYWIYDPSTKTWYSPKEFKEAFDRFHTGFDDFFAQCQIRDPQDGFNAGLTHIQRLINEIKAFASKIVNYYKPK